MKKRSKKSPAKKQVEEETQRIGKEIWDHLDRRKPLDDALAKLEEDALPKNATAITIDDGWYGTFKFQYPVLRKHDFLSRNLWLAGNVVAIADDIPSGNL